MKQRRSVACERGERAGYAVAREGHKPGQRHCIEGPPQRCGTHSSLKRRAHAMPDTSAHLLRNALGRFWAPVPWLLEASIPLAPRTPLPLGFVAGEFPAAVIGIALDLIKFPVIARLRIA